MTGELSLHPVQPEKGRERRKRGVLCVRVSICVRLYVYTSVATLGL